MLDSRSNKFVSEEINELIKEMKKILFEMTEIKFKLKNFEKYAKDSENPWKPKTERSRFLS